MYSASIQKLIQEFSKFPTVGPRTAARFAFYIMRAPKREQEELTKAISKLAESIKICAYCLKSFESEKQLCEICADTRRDKTLLCIVEKEIDLLSLEKTGKYKGLYFILGGPITALNKEQVKKLPIEQLKERIKPECREIILAVNPTTEGASTSLYLKKTLQSFGKKISQLGLGLPIGGELEYADEETLSSALSGRKQL